MSTEQRSGQGGHTVDRGAYAAWLFDLDRVLSKTAAIRAAAWKQAFAEFLDSEATARKRRSHRSTRRPTTSATWTESP